MESRPQSLKKKSAVLSIVLEEITDDDDCEDDVDGAAEGDAHDGLAQSALKRQETVEKLEQQGRTSYTFCSAFLGPSRCYVHIGG